MTLPLVLPIVILFAINRIGGFVSELQHNNCPHAVASSAILVNLRGAESQNGAFIFFVIQLGKEAANRFLKHLPVYYKAT